MSFNADVAIQHMKDLRARGITYSMDGSRTGTDGTADCSGAVYASLVAAGMPAMSYVPNTDSMHAWLQSNGWQLLSVNNEWNAQKGDVIIWGLRGASSGGAGHTGIMMDHDNFINCSWRSDSNNGVMIDNYDSYWERVGQPFFYVYRYVGGDQTSFAAKPAPLPHNVDVHYGLHVLGGDWLPFVTNSGDGENGFAGLPNHQHDLLSMWVSRGQIKYRVHTAQSGWLPWITAGTSDNHGDTVNGCAGIIGQAIDGVQIYYVTPAGESFQQAYYRSQNINQPNWLPVCCDDGNSVPGYDGWAGIYGSPLDRLQVEIYWLNPF